MISEHLRELVAIRPGDPDPAENFRRKIIRRGRHPCTVVADFYIVPPVPKQPCQPVGRILMIVHDEVWLPHSFSSKATPFSGGDSNLLDEPRVEL